MNTNRKKAVIMDARKASNAMKKILAFIILGIVSIYIIVLRIKTGTFITPIVLVVANFATFFVYIAIILIVLALAKFFNTLTGADEKRIEESNRLYENACKSPASMIKIDPLNTEESYNGSNGDSHEELSKLLIYSNSQNNLIEEKVNEYKEELKALVEADFITPKQMEEMLNQKEKELNNN